MPIDGIDVCFLEVLFPRLLYNPDKHFLSFQILYLILKIEVYL